MECQFCKTMFDNLDDVQLHQAGTGCHVIEAGDSDVLDVTTGTPAAPIDVLTPMPELSTTPKLDATIETPVIPNDLNNSMQSRTT